MAVTAIPKCVIFKRLIIIVPKNAKTMLMPKSIRVINVTPTIRCRQYLYLKKKNFNLLTLGLQSFNNRRDFPQSSINVASGLKK